MQYPLSNPVQLAHLLMSARKSKGLTQAAAAARVGISQSRLSVLETDPSSLTFEQLLALMSLYELRVTAQDKRPASAPESW